MKKRILSSAVGMLVMLTGCMDLTVLDKENIKLPERPIPNIAPEIEEIQEEMHESEWYFELCEGLLQGKKSVKTSSHVSNEDVGRALTQMYTDYPEISWVGQSYYAEKVTDASRIKVALRDDMDEDEIKKIRKEISDAADEVISQIPENSSDYEKILFVHDYIINNTEYDYLAAAYDDGGTAYTAYGCLIEGKAVCSGYAKAFQYIMNRLGIESGVATGSNHAWNYVKADGDYYWIDTTWDDTALSEPIHSYFMFTTEQLLNSRNFASVQSRVPDCTATKDNYFIRNGGYFSEYNEKEIISYVKNHLSDEGFCEIQFDSFETYSDAYEKLIVKRKLRKAMEKSGKMTYSANDDMFTIYIIFSQE